MLCPMFWTMSAPIMVLSMLWPIMLCPMFWTMGAPIMGQFDTYSVASFSPYCYLSWGKTCPYPWCTF